MMLSKNQLLGFGEERPPFMIDTREPVEYILSLTNSKTYLKNERQNVPKKKQECHFTDVDAKIHDSIWK